MDEMGYEDYVNTGYVPKEEELVCEFYFRTVEEVDWAAGAIAAESSIGTWDPNLSTMREGIREIGATVFDVDGLGTENGLNTAEISVAYPPELFEKGSLPQILSSITGNIYGLEELENLRLLDAEFPETAIEGFPGPTLGIEKIKQRVGAENRPLVGTIVKPKLGLNPEQHAQVAYDSWTGGLDIVKDDENLTDMSFNGFRERVEGTLNKKREAEDRTGDSKIYFPNVTAPVSEMKERVDVVVQNGGGYVMVDILTAGWSAVQEIRRYLDTKAERGGKEIGIHAHRAQHAAYTRLSYHGISMLSIAKFARLAGVDNLHAGTVVGKMEGEKDEVTDIYDFLRSDWHGKKTTIPVASGGLHPGLVPDLVDMLGEDIVIQAGGGVHGHPNGSKSGARALRDAVEAVERGRSLEEKAETSPELSAALDKWGRERT